MKSITQTAFILIMIFLGITHQSKASASAMDTNPGSDTASFASGCFWCSEAIFQELEGVERVASGYTGGHVKNPAYREVCDGTTGHAEAIRIIFDPLKISFTELLEVFFATHDPTSLNRQGADVGTQYRSAIFYHNDIQKEESESIIRKLNEAKVWPDPIVTEVSPAEAFYLAEDYHQNYFKNNQTAAYCNFVIIPKLEKFKKVFSQKLKQ